MIENRNQAIIEENANVAPHQDRNICNIKNLIEAGERLHNINFKCTEINLRQA